MSSFESLILHLNKANLQSILITLANESEETVQSKIQTLCEKIYHAEANGMSNTRNITQSVTSDNSSKQNIASQSHKKEKTTDKKVKKKVFDINKYQKRHIAFQIQYDGSAYVGFASQEASNTVEEVFFSALEKLQLISDRKTCQYSRCGRTDKGVHALGQIVALQVRSTWPLDLLTPSPPCSLLDTVSLSVPMTSNDQNNHQTTQQQYMQEMDYMLCLNRILPSDVRVLGVSAVSDKFTARFSATSRTYRYYFTKQHYNITKMQRACQYLMGKHDFRNLCKLDIINVSNFEREIFTAQIYSACSTTSNNHHEDHHDREYCEVYVFEVTGVAFLWHMVRCIMSVLFLIGREQEAPTVFQDLFDITTQPAKPTYEMADADGLLLYRCGFDHLLMEASPAALWELTAHYQGLRDKHLIKLQQIQEALDYIAGLSCHRRHVDMWECELEKREEKLKQQVISKQQHKHRRRSLEQHQQQQQEKDKKGKGLIEMQGGDMIAESSSSSYTNIASSAVVSVHEVSNNDDGHNSGNNKKRKHDHIILSTTIEGDEGDESKATASTLSWQEVCREIVQKFHRYPLDPYSAYVPLLQRNTEDSYEERVAQLKGMKKATFTSNMTTQQEENRLHNHNTVGDREAEETVLMNDDDKGGETEHHDRQRFSNNDEFFRAMRQEGSLLLVSK